MKISIVLPCYKSEDYVANMINDTIEQTYKNWELIVVSNGPEQEAQNKIIEQIISVEPRIRIIKTDKPGVSHARNLGMRNATGDWLMFVDADDRLMPDHLQKYVDTVSLPENNNIDIVVSGYWRKTVNDKSPRPIPLTPFRGIDFFKISQNYSAIYCPCNKLLNINALRDWGGVFDENITCGEDGVFAFSLLNFTQNIIAIDLNGYIYNDRPGSAMHSFHKNYHEGLQILKKEMVSLFSKTLSNDELQQFIHNRNYYNSSWEICNLMRQGSPYNFIQTIKEVYKIITEKQLRASLPYLNLETNSPIEKIKIALIKCRASLLLTLIYKFKQ